MVSLLLVNFVRLYLFGASYFTNLIISGLQYNKQIDLTGGRVTFLLVQMSERAACRSFASLHEVAVATSGQSTNLININVVIGLPTNLVAG